MQFVEKWKCKANSSGVICIHILDSQQTKKKCVKVFFQTGM